MTTCFFSISHAPIHHRISLNNRVATRSPFCVYSKHYFLHPCCHLWTYPVSFLYLPCFISPNMNSHTLLQWTTYFSYIFMPVLHLIDSFLPIRPLHPKKRQLICLPRMIPACQFWLCLLDHLLVTCLSHHTHRGAHNPNIILHIRLIDTERWRDHVRVYVVYVWKCFVRRNDTDTETCFYRLCQKRWALLSHHLKNTIKLYIHSTSNLQNRF